MSTDPGGPHPPRRLGITVWRSLIILAVAITIVAFARQYEFGMVLDFFREGEPFDRFALMLFVLVFLPPLVERLRLPGLLGLILGGVLFGPDVLALGRRGGEVATFFSELGRVFLMFLAGLEVDLRSFRRFALPSIVFGLMTFAAPMAAGWALGRYFGYGEYASLLIGSLLASHTLLGFPILEQLGLVKARFSMVTIGATILTDIASLLVLAVCVSAHVSGSYSTDELWKLLFALAVYCVLVLGAIPWMGKSYLARRAGNEAAQFQFVLLAIVLCAIGAKLIDLEDIVGAFLCGVAINLTVGHGPAREKIEFLGKTLFVPAFLILIGVNLDLAGFARSLSSGLPFVLGIVSALVAAKLLAATLTALLCRFRFVEGLAMWSLSLPQLAATLAAALTAYQTKNTAGERLIDELVLNGVLVLMVVTAAIGPILTQKFGQRIRVESAEPGMSSADGAASVRA